MNSSQVWSKGCLVAVLCAAGFTMLPATAQQAPVAIAPPPPELQTLEEGEPPAVTIRKPGDDQSEGNSITEQRSHGQTKEIKVKSGPSTYYLKPQAQVGSSVPGDAQSGPPTAAQWKVKEFDWGGSKNPKETQPGAGANK